MTESELLELSRELDARFDPEDPDIEKRLESYLSDRWADSSRDQRIQRLTRLIAAFESRGGVRSAVESDDPIPGIFAQILKGQVTPDEISSAAFLEELAASLDTLFDELNRLIRFINSLLMGSETGEKTIRHIIGAQMRGALDEMSIPAYIGQIQDAFKIAHDAFQISVKEMVGEIIAELDPEQIVAGADLSRFDPLKKSRYFALYEEKFSKFRRWHDSGRFDEAFLRVFEKNCYHLSLKQGK